jgi:hypothetical protein
MSMRYRAAAAIAFAATCAGCSVRYDASGVTRVGIGLWGFGDPPGVNWYLDAPRREVPDLPAGARPELPPRRGTPDGWGSDAQAPVRARDENGIEPAIGDNRDRWSAPPSEVARPMAVRTRALLDPRD